MEGFLKEKPLLNLASGSYQHPGTSNQKQDGGTIVEMAFKTKWWERWLARAFHVLLTTMVITALLIKDTGKNQLNLLHSSLALKAEMLLLLHSLVDSGGPYIIYGTTITVENENGLLTGSLTL